MRLLLALTLTVTVLVISVLVLGDRTSPSAGPSSAGSPSDGSPIVGAGTPQAAAPLARFLDSPRRGADGQVFPRRAGRLPLVGTHPEENRHALGAAVVSPAYVSGLVLDHQVLMGDVALPWRYWLDPAVAARVDEATVHDAVAEWDDVPGSRWRSSFQGVQTGVAQADGRSTVFMESSCDASTTANTYLFTDGGLGVDRYGTGATQILEADIGVCPRVTDPTTLARAVRHEVGHVAGLSHLCDRGDDCWVPAMGEASHACRVMFWQARACQTAIDDGDRLALATLYPTLRPLTGPTPADAGARASFGLLQDRAAPLVVVLQPTASERVAAPAAALAARGGGPLLLADADPNSCMVGAGAREVSRVLAHRGTLVLVGDWPDVCQRVAYDWDVRLRRVPLDDADQAARRLADLGGPASQVVLLDARTVTDGGLTAAWLAARLDAPLLYADDADAARWLADRGIPRTVQPDADVTPSSGSPVVLVGTTGGLERFAAVPVAVLGGATMLQSGEAVEPAVLHHLTAGVPPSGWTVGLTGWLSPTVHAVYASRVGAG